MPPLNGSEPRPLEAACSDDHSLISIRHDTHRSSRPGRTVRSLLTGGESLERRWRTQLVICDREDRLFRHKPAMILWPTMLGRGDGSPTHAAGIPNPGRPRGNTRNVEEFMPCDEIINRPLDMS